MPEFRKKPIIVEAEQWTGQNWDSMATFMGGRIVVEPDNSLLIETLEGNHKGSVGDWIIKGVKGEFYPVKDAIFRETYEKVADASRPMSQFDFPAAIKELAEARCRCDDCQGKGVRDRIAPPSCPKCAGTGYYEPFASLRIPCPNSGGRGKETKWHQTCVCGGRCWVPEPDREKACWRILQVVRTPAIVSLIMRNGLTVETALGAALVWVKEQHAVIS